MYKNSKKLTFTTCGFVILLAACGGGNAVKTNAEKKVSDASEKSIKYEVDSKSSTFKWTGKKKLVKSSHSGTIELKSGLFEVENGQLAAGNFIVNMETIKNTEEGAGAKLVGHLSSKDFFYVEQYPESIFEITKTAKLSSADEAGNNYKISGNLTIKDHTHNIVFPAKVKINNEKIIAEASFSIDRTKWDVRYGSGKFFKSLGDKVIADEISFDIKLVAEKQN